MGKSTIFFGQLIFSQMIGLLNKSKITTCALSHKSDHYCKRFSTFKHLITMVYGVISECNSLRELCGGIVSYGDKISHCKFDYAPKRSTISDANKRRDCIVFEDIYADLVKEYLPNLSDSHKQLIIDKKVYHSNTREHNSLFIQKEGVMNKGEMVLFDKAYNNYALFDTWNKSEIFFVTRLKNNAKETLLEEFDLTDTTPNEVLRDAKIALKYKDKQGVEKQVELRLVSFYHKEKNKVYYFLSNLFNLPAEQIVLLYKKKMGNRIAFQENKAKFSTTILLWR